MANLDFKKYVEHGWALVRIQDGQKAPRHTGWNREERVERDPEKVKWFDSAGLCHAYSGTCALDVDRFDDAQKWLEERGIDLRALFNAPDAVQLISGQANRGKLIYKLEEPLPSVSLDDGAFELRCASKTGRTVQDVLPPSRHPKGGRYHWQGDWQDLPPLPASLRAIWREAIGPRTEEPPDLPERTAEINELFNLIAKHDPDCGYDEWVKVGMAVHHETAGSDDGLALWNKWSETGSKYPGFEELRVKWESFGNAPNPVTVGYLRATDAASPEEFEDLSEKSGSFSDTNSPQPNEPKRFSFLSLTELFNRPEPDWIIEGAFPEAMLGTIWGHPGGGKTFAAVDLAVSIALGRSWKGLPVKQGRVLYIAAEDDAGVQLRFASKLAALGAPDAPVSVLPAAPNLTSSEQRKALYESILAEPRPSVIFVDTLSATTAGADENSSKDMTLLMDYWKRVSKATGAIVILVHHANKGDSMRGSSALHGGFDVEWKVTDGKGQRTLLVHKLKNAPDKIEHGFTLGLVGHSCEVEWL